MWLKLATLVSIYGTGPTADRYNPLSVGGHRYDVFSSEFPKNVFTIDCQCQMDGLCP